jgi:hypothetical protein
VLHQFDRCGNAGVAAQHERIQKAKPLKKTLETDAIFANVKAVRQEMRDDPTTLEISIDTKAKVKEGEYSRGGKKPDRFGG